MVAFSRKVVLPGPTTYANYYAHSAFFEKTFGQKFEVLGAAMWIVRWIF